MMIKSKDSAWIVFWITVLGTLMLNAAISYDAYTSARELFGMTFFLYIPAYLLYINVWLSMGKTLIMDERGCTVKLLMFTKFYPWEHFTVKQIVHYQEAYGIRVSHSKGATFIHKKIDELQKMLPEYYSMLLAPLSVIYVKFPEPDIKPGDKLDFYVVDESLFREKMDEWGVELDEVHY